MSGAVRPPIGANYFGRSEAKSYDFPSRLAGARSARREAQRLDRSLGVAVGRNDRKSAEYLAARRARLDRCIRAMGWPEVDDDVDSMN